jgi:hypothetical protein
MNTFSQILSRTGRWLYATLTRAWPHIWQLFEQVIRWIFSRPRNFFCTVIIVLLVLPQSRFWVIDTAFVLGIMLIVLNIGLLATDREPWFPGQKNQS